MNTIKLYSPLFLQVCERNEYGDLDECPTELPAREAAEWFDKIDLLVRRENDRLPARGLMEYFHGEQAVSDRVYSAVPSVEMINGEPFGVTVCKVNGEFNDAEMAWLKEFIVGQYADGYGESLEQRPIKIDGGELYVSFWDSCNFYIKTENEFYGNKQSQGSPAAEKSTQFSENLRETLRGLTNTAIEKACVLGEEAKDDIASLRATVCELVRFWNLDERYIDQFDMDVAEVMPQETLQMGGM